MCKVTDHCDHGTQGIRKHSRLQLFGNLSAALFSLYSMCGKLIIFFNCAWRQHEFWENIPYCVPSAALYVEGKATVLLLKDMNGLLICSPAYKHGAYSILQLHRSPFCHGAKLRAEGVKSFSFPSVTVQKYTMQVNHRLIYFALLDGGVN